MRSLKMAQSDATLTANDRLAIMELTARYAFYVDTFQVDALIDLFLHDAVMDESKAGLSCHFGKTEIRAYFADDLFPRLTGMLHLTGNHIMTLEPDGRVRGLVSNLFQGDMTDGSAIHGTCWYDDVYARTPHGWKFASRTVTPFTNLQVGDLTQAL
jgi:hypothetical protein